MTKDETVALAAVTAMVSVATIQVIKNHREQKRIRAEIKAKLAVDLDAIHTAELIVAERMATGGYTCWRAVLDDLHFQTIVKANKL